MTDLEARLYFSLPVPSLRDVRIALMLDCQYGQREGILSIVQSQASIFDDFFRVYPILKDYYGQTKKEVGQEETPKKISLAEASRQEETPKKISLAEASRQEKIFREIPFEEKQKIFRVKKVFQGRYI